MIGKCLGLWFEGKKWGQLRKIFLTPKYLSLPGSQKYFLEYLCENKNILVCESRDMRFLNSHFSHKSIVPIPLSNILKYFCKYFCFSWIYLQKYFWLLGYDTRKSKKWSLLDPIFFLLQIINQGMHQSTIGDFCINIQF